MRIFGVSEKTARRKMQKKAKRRRYSRCSVCGEWAACRLEEIPDEIGNAPDASEAIRVLWTLRKDVPVKKCRNGHVQLLLWLGGGTGRRIP